MYDDNYHNLLPSYEEVVGNLLKNPTQSTSSISTVPTAPPSESSKSNSKSKFDYTASSKSPDLSRVTYTIDDTFDAASKLSQPIATKFKPTSTLKPYPNFDVNGDLNNIRTAIASKNKAHLTEILCHRSTEQRLEICQIYDVSSAHSLQHDIKAKFGSEANFTGIIIGLAQPFPAYLARVMFYSVKDYYWFVHTFFMLSNDVCQNLQLAFKMSKCSSFKR